MSVAPVIRHIGVLTSGGDSPGMNAAIRATVRCAAVHGIRTTGILGGYNGLVSDLYETTWAAACEQYHTRGGTIIRSARSEVFRTEEGVPRPQGPCVGMEWTPWSRSGVMERSPGRTSFSRNMEYA